MRKQSAPEHYGPDMTESPPRNLSRHDSAVYLGVSRSTLDRIERRGELDSIRIGRRRRFRVADLKRYLEEGGP